jgi:hypothetical protein
VAVVFLVALAAEAGARIIITRVSRVENRAVCEYTGIFHPVPRRPLVLFLGNSLLDAAIDFPALHQALASDVDARRYVVDNTAYYDWYYGIRRILAAGARPRAIALMLSDLQFSVSSIRGDYSALRLMQASDIPELSAKLGMHPTQTVSMLLANRSVFYGLRGEIRKVLLGRLMPELPRLTAMLVAQRGDSLSDHAFHAVAAERIVALRALCETYGSRLVLLVPPLPGNSGERLVVVARDALAGVVRPFSDGQFQPEHFSDGFHLNETGQAIYTGKLAAELKQRNVLLTEGTVAGGP